MPCLKYIVQNADSKDYKLLRGKTIECISLIGLAVGQQKVGFQKFQTSEIILSNQVEQECLCQGRSFENELFA